MIKNKEGKTCVYSTETIHLQSQSNVQCAKKVTYCNQIDRYA